MLNDISGVPGWAKVPPPPISHLLSLAPHRLHSKCSLPHGLLSTVASAVQQLQCIKSVLRWMTSYFSS